MGRGLWITKGIFALGEGGTGRGLQYAGLRQRLLDRVEEDGDDQLRESTPEELVEEQAALKAVVQGERKAFHLDTAMHVVLDASGVHLRSVVPYTEELAQQVRGLGPVRSLIAASLQHWLFVPQWKEAFPGAQIYITPAACGECLRGKLGDLGADAIELVDGCGQISPDLDHLLFRGAPLNMNETVALHMPSRTLLCDDAFYGGYGPTCATSWFTRAWFKATKGGSFSSSRLPSYRTSRVHTHGDASALAASLTSVLAWEFDKIAYCHGHSVCTENAKEQFHAAWRVVLDEAALTAPQIEPVIAPTETQVRFSG